MKSNTAGTLQASQIEIFQRTQAAGATEIFPHTIQDFFEVREQKALKIVSVCLNA